MAPASANSTDTGTGWQGRRAVAASLRLAVFLIPLLTGMTASIIAARLLPAPSTTATTVLWWLAVLGAGSAASVLTDRLAVRLLPLAALYSLTIVFPDRTPSRFRIARRATSLQDARQAMTDLDTTAPVQHAAETALALITALDVHHRATRGHAERVRLLTDLVGEQLELSLPDRIRLRWAALLHDLGKLHVHRDLLVKPGQPTDREWEELRRHPAEGARLCEPLVPWLGQWALAVGEHHERFDGTGYPYGVEGEAISLAGRIVAVTDAYDVMTARRSYKTAVTPDQARAELVACAGTHFDPAIVRSFLQVALPGRSRLLLPLQWVLSSPFAAQVRSLGSSPAMAPLHTLAVAAPRVAMTAAAIGLIAAPAHRTTQTRPEPAPPAFAAPAIVAPAAPPQGPQTQPSLPRTDADDVDAEVLGVVVDSESASPHGNPPSPAPDPMATDPAPPPTVVLISTAPDGQPPAQPEQDQAGSFTNVLDTTFALLAAAPRDHTAVTVMPLGPPSERLAGAAINLDADRDDLAGVLLRRTQPRPTSSVDGNAAWGIRDEGPVVATGFIDVTAWLALDGFVDGNAAVAVDLLDCNQELTSCTAIASGTAGLRRTAPDASGFAPVSASLGPILHVLQPGRTLTLAFTADPSSSADVLLAAGSDAVPSQLTGLSIAPLNALSIVSLGLVALAEPLPPARLDSGI